MPTIEIDSTTETISVEAASGIDYIRSTSIGEKLGTFSFAAGAAQASSPDPASLVLRQYNLDEAVLGYVLVAKRSGMPDSRFPFLLGRFFTLEEWSLPVSGEAINVTFAPNRDDDSFDGDMLSLTNKESPFGEAVTVDVHLLLASPSAGVSSAQISAWQADLSGFEREIAQIQASEQAVPQGTDAEAQAGTSTANRLWSAARLRLAAVSSLTRAVIARVTGGFQLPPTQSANVLHLRSVNADNTVSVLDFHAGTQAPQGAGLAAWQATNIAGNLLATVTEFTFVPATSTTPGVLTYRSPLPADGSIVLRMLATDLQDTINGKLDASQVRARIESNPVVLAIQAFENDLRRTRNLASNLAWTQHASSAYFRFPSSSIELPNPKAGDRIRFVVAPTGVASFTTDFIDYATFFGKTSSNSQPASTANGTRFVDANNDGYFFSREGNQLLAAAESIGNVSVTIELNEIDLKGFARLSGPLITEADLSQAIRTKLDEAHDSGLNTAQVTALITRLIAENQINADEVARKPVRFARPSQGEDITVSANISWQIGQTNYTVGRITLDDRGQFIIGVNNVGTQDALRNYEIRIGDTTLDFSAMNYEAGSGANDGSNPDSYVSGGGNSVSTTADTVIEIVRPITANSYLPLEGVTDYPMTKTATGRHWAQLKTAGIADAAVTAPKLADDSVTNRTILANAVSPDKIHPRGRIPDATSLDAGRVPRTTAQSTYETVPVDNSFLKRWVGTSAQLPAADQRDADVFYYVVSS